MTQVARIFEEEKQQALSQAEKRFEEEKQRESKNVVVRMIKMNYPTEEIVSVMPDYSQEDVEEIRKEVVDLSV